MFLLVPFHDPAVLTPEEDEEQLLMRRMRNSVDDLKRGMRNLDYKMQRVKVKAEQAKEQRVYHQLISVYKIKCDQKPVYLWEKFRDKFNYKTRQATGNCLQVSRTPKSDTSKDSFVHKSTILWNTLPVKLRTSQLSLLKFKMELKIWVKANIQI